jgi:hypothetical protein
VIPFARGHHYIGAVIPGSYSPLWAAMVLTSEGGKRIVVAHRQWGDEEIAPDAREVYPELLSWLRTYRLPLLVPGAQREPRFARGALTGFLVDQFVPLELCEEFRLARIILGRRELNPERSHTIFEGLRIILEARRVVLPDDPLIKEDLLTVARGLTQAGPKITLPTNQHGRHAEYARLLAMLCHEPCPEPTRDVPTSEEAKIIARLEKPRGVFTRATTAERQPFWRQAAQLATLRRR